MRTISARIARLTAACALTLTLGATAGAGPALAMPPCTSVIFCPTSITLAGIAPVPEADAGATDKYTPASIDTLAAGEDASTTKIPGNLAVGEDAGTDKIPGELGDFINAPVATYSSGMYLAAGEDASTTKIPGNLDAPIDTRAAEDGAGTDGADATAVTFSSDDDDAPNGQLGAI